MYVWVFCTSLLFDLGANLFIEIYLTNNQANRSINLIVERILKGFNVYFYSYPYPNPYSLLSLQSSRVLNPSLQYVDGYNDDFSISWPDCLDLPNKQIWISYFFAGQMDCRTGLLLFYEISPDMSGF